MSQENEEIVHRALAAWNGRDMEAILALTDPEVEYVNSPTAVEPGTRWGHAGLEDVFRAQDLDAGHPPVVEPEGHEEAIFDAGVAPRHPPRTGAVVAEHETGLRPGRGSGLSPTESRRRHALMRTLPA
jgi:ketosteroid isomerase-like protein